MLTHLEKNVSNQYTKMSSAIAQLTVTWCVVVVMGFGSRKKSGSLVLEVEFAYQETFRKN